MINVSSSVIAGAEPNPASSRVLASELMRQYHSCFEVNTRI
jgi:hypothetical protein